MLRDVLGSSNYNGWNAACWHLIFDVLFLSWVPLRVFQRARQQNLRQVGCSRRASKECGAQRRRLRRSA